MITEKTCSQCKINKPASEFYKLNNSYTRKNKRESSYSHLTARCKPCHSAHIAKIRKDKADYYKAKRLDYVAANPEKVKKLFSKYTRKYQALHPDKIKQWAKNRYEKHRDSIKEYGKHYRDKNREQIKKTQHDYYLRHRKQIIKTNTAYYFAHREQLIAQQRERRKRNKLTTQQN